jgi:hypothetical protein
VKRQNKMEMLQLPAREMSILTSLRSLASIGIHQFFCSSVLNVRSAILISSLVFISGFPVDARGAESNVIKLYRRFLSGADSSGFVLFTAEVVPPESQKAGTNMGVPRSPPRDIQPQYCAYFWDGPQWIVALSSTTPIKTTSELSSARMIYGFDNTNYWSITLQHPVRASMPTGGLPSLPPTELRDFLALIPVEEAARSREIQSNPALSAILLLIADCRRVTQFGYSFENTQAPEKNAGGLLVHGAATTNTTILHITGNPDYPDIVACDVPSPGFRVQIDYTNDALTMDQLSPYGPLPARRSRYKILSLEDFIVPSGPDLFSWQTYRGLVQVLDASITTNGATSLAYVTQDNVLQSRGRTVPSQSKQDRHKKLIIFLLGATVGAPFAWFAIKKTMRLAHTHKGE